MFTVYFKKMLNVQFTIVQHVLKNVPHVSINVQFVYEIFQHVFKNSRNVFQKSKKEINQQEKKKTKKKRKTDREKHKKKDGTFPKPAKTGLKVQRSNPRSFPKPLATPCWVGPLHRSLEASISMDLAFACQGGSAGYLRPRQAWLPVPLDHGPYQLQIFGDRTGYPLAPPPNGPVNHNGT